MLQITENHLHNGKTKVFDVHRVDDNVVTVFGEIKWLYAHNAYCFVSRISVVLNADEMHNISEKMDELMRERQRESNQSVQH